VLLVKLSVFSNLSYSVLLSAHCLKFPLIGRNYRFVKNKTLFQELAKGKPKVMPVKLLQF